MYQNDTSGLLILGLLVGAAAGVAAGFLLAPGAGNETREILRQGIGTGAERVRELCCSIQAQVEETTTE